MIRWRCASCGTEDDAKQDYLETRLCEECYDDGAGVVMCDYHPCQMICGGGDMWCGQCGNCHRHCDGTWDNCLGVWSNLHLQADTVSAVSAGFYVQVGLHIEKDKANTSFIALKDDEGAILINVPHWFGNKRLTNVLGGNQAAWDEFGEALDQYADHLQNWFYRLMSHPDVIGDRRVVDARSVSKGGGVAFSHKYIAVKLQVISELWGLEPTIEDVCELTFPIREEEK